MTQHARPSSGLFRFVLLSTVQAIVLIAVVVLCYRSLDRLRQRLEVLGGTLPQATAVAEVLHYSDVLRVIHVSLIGAGTNAEYVDVRLKRLKEVEDMMEASIVRMEALQWSVEDRGLVTKVAAGMRAYGAAFPPVLEASRKATPAELPDLIQANTALRRDAYNILLEMLPGLQNRAEIIVRSSGSDFRRVQILILTGLALTIVLGSWIFRSFASHRKRTREQAQELNRAMEAVSNGDLSRTCAVISDDELGQVAENLNQIFGLLARNIRTIAEISTKLNSVADTVGSRSQTVMSSAEGQVQALGGAYSSIDNLNGGIRDIAVNVEALSTSSEETSSSTLELLASMAEVARHTDTLFSSVEETSSATQQTVSSIKEVDHNVDYLRNFVTDTSASMAQMSSSIAEVERSAARSHELARTVCDAADSGMAAVQQTIAGMDEIRRSVVEANTVVSRLGQRSTEIGRIVNVIDDIAKQTNLLALNAAILAAQAGDRGSGFSVVADEIRELAERTASSTKEIGSLVGSVQDEVEKALSSMSAGSHSADRGVTLAGDAGRALEKILDSSHNSLDMGKNIAAALAEQAGSAQSVARSVEKLQDMVKHINAATNQQAVGSVHILETVEQMRDMTNSVRQATIEQKSGATLISQAAERMSDVVNQISTTTAGQADESQKIVQVMEQVRNITESNRRAATEMNKSVEFLSGAIHELEKELAKFNVGANTTTADINPSEDFLQPFPSNARLPIRDARAGARDDFERRPAGTLGTGRDVRT